MHLESPRLRFRLFRAEDADTFSAYRSDPEVARYQGWDTPYPLEEAQAFIAVLSAPNPPLPGEWYQLALELKAGAALIGDCAFSIRADDARQAEIGYTLARRYHGHGYGIEAVTLLLDYLFGELDLHRVTATTDVLNTASIRLLERVGFRREAHYIENVWFKGEWGSEYAYAVLQREWAARSRPLAAVPNRSTTMSADPNFRMTVEDVFAIRGRGTVVTGRIESGTLTTGDEVQLNRAGTVRTVTITAIESFRKVLNAAKAGDNVGILLKDLTREDVQRGDVLEGRDSQFTWKP